MASLRYTNVILTILAVLLVAQLWTTWSAPGTPTMPQRVEAAPPTNSTPGGLPDSGADRRDMIDLLKKQVQKTDEVLTYLKSGEMRVRLEAGKPNG